MRGRAWGLRRNRKGVAVAFAEVLMVVTMVAMSGAVYIMFSTLTQDAADLPTAITFRTFGSTPATIPDICCLNDTLLEVSTALGHPQIWLPQIEYTISAAGTGETLVVGYLEEEPANATQIYLGVYHGSDDEPSIVNVWYSDVDRNGIISISDHIVVRGQSREYHQAIFRAYNNNHELGWQVLA